MTITDNDREQYQSIASNFHIQHEPDSCFPTAIKNVLDELAVRKDNQDFSSSISEISDALEYKKGLASRSDRLSRRIDPLIEETNWEVCYMSGMDYKQLETVISSDDYSFPICELHEQYFEDIGQHTDQYVAEKGIDGWGRWKHTVIPFDLNESRIVYYDTYAAFFNNTEKVDNAGIIEVPIEVFNEWWARPVKRWAMWFEPSVQTRISDYVGE